MSNLLKQSSAAQPLIFLMIDSTDHLNGKTGLTPTVKLSKAGGTGAVPAGAVSEIDATNMPGWYKVAGNATDTNTLGPLILHATATGADPVDAVYNVVAFDPQDAVRMGQSALPNAAAGATNGLVVIGTGANKFKSDASSNVTVGGYATSQDPGTMVRDMPDNTLSINTLGYDIKNGFLAANSVDQKLTTARAGYLDILNTTALATQADINALNQSASRRVILVTVGQYERPESGSSTYTVEARTYDGDGAAVDADSTPTLTATGIVTGSLSGNLSAATSPATGVYRWTYTVASNATIEQVRFDLSATIGGTVFPMTVYTQVADFVAATFTTADRTLLTGINAKTTALPAAPAAVSDIPTAAQNAAGLLDLANGVETGWTFRQVMRLIGSVLAGKSSSNGTVFRDLNDTKARVTGTVDGSGNRTAVTRDAT